MRGLIRLFFVTILLCISFSSCHSKVVNDYPTDVFADLVVYGQVFTAEANELAGAFAVKDGKYIAVGPSEQMIRYVGPQTKVIVHENGMVMPGCTEGHGHYLMSNFYDYAKSVIRFDNSDTRKTILDKVKAMAATNPTYIYGFGFNYLKLKGNDDFPTRQELDFIAPDIPVYLADSEGHKGIANSHCFDAAKILDADGKVSRAFKYWDYVVVDKWGYPTGLLLEQAGTYVRVKGCTPDDPESTWAEVVRNSMKELNSMGYTAAFEGWANKFGLVTYKVLHDMDRSGEMTMNMALAYEIENLSAEEVTNDLQMAVDAKRYNGKHVYANYVKLFEDGTPESGTGYMIVPNPRGSRGKGIWSPEELESLTFSANRNGLTMHIHAMGDAAVKDVVNAYEKAHNVQLGMRNQIVHLRNVDAADYDRMARCGMVASSGVLWHSIDPEERDFVLQNEVVARQYGDEGYPYQSFINHRVHTTISTDAPATAGAPTDPFGIMEVAQTGTQTFGQNYFPVPWDLKECIRDRADFLRSLTIEGAYQMGTEQTRGSIAVGKYADFILIDQNVLTCQASLLHQTKVLKTFFEGKCVYVRKSNE